MSENFLGQIKEYDNNNEASFSPVDQTQHCTKNSYGKVIHSSFLVGNPRPNTPAVVMEADCQASEEIAFTTNNFDSKQNIPLGGGGLQNPINSKIQVFVLENSVEIKAGTSTVQILEDGNISITSNGNILQEAGTSSITINKNGNISMSVAGTPVANFSQSSVNFLVPVNMPVGSKLNNKLIAVQGSITTGSPLQHTITNTNQ
jgi:hypothetical protein